MNGPTLLAEHTSGATYAALATKYGLTRNQVAGLIRRARVGTPTPAKLLPAPRIAGLLPPPRYQAVERANIAHWSGPGIWITTSAGTFAVLDEQRLGESFAELVRAQGPVELVEVRQLELFEQVEAA